MDLFKMHEETPLREAEAWFLHDFRPASWGTISAQYTAGTPDSVRIERVLRFWELVGALIDHGLLNEDLLFDVLPSVEPVWQRIEPWIAQARGEWGNDTWENIEILAARQRHWRQLHRPKATRL
jgi:hypothetical protein